MLLTHTNDQGQISLTQPPGVTLRGVPTQEKGLHTPEGGMIEVLTVQKCEWPFIV